MAWETINNSELQPGKPILPPFRKTKNSLDWLYGQLGTAATTGGILNGAFEVDSDANGQPDNWTLSLYPGGSGQLMTPGADGAGGVQLIHPGGAGNGGGYYESDYIVCSELRRVFLSFAFRATTYWTQVRVEIRYFDYGKVYLSAENIYNSVDNPTTWTLQTAAFTPPAGARYYKIRLVGGDPANTVAGTTYFDCIREAGLELLLRRTLGATTIAEVNTGETAWVDIGLPTTLRLPFSNIPVSISFAADIKELYAADGSIRFRIGGYYSNEITAASTGDWQSHNFTIPAVQAYGTVQLQMQLAYTGSGGQVVYGRKSSDTTVKVDPANL